MPAPDFRTLLAIEDNIVSAAVSVLNANQLQAFGPRGDIDLPKERVDLLAAGFAKASEHMVQDAAGNWHDSHYRGTIEVVITSPRGDRVAAARHGSRAGLVRYLFSRRAQSFTPASLPYYEVLSIDELTPSVFTPGADEDDLDRTTLTFDIQVAIRPSAIPM